MQMVIIRACKALAFSGGGMFEVNRALFFTVSLVNILQMRMVYYSFCFRF